MGKRGSCTVQACSAPFTIGARGRWPAAFRANAPMPVEASTSRRVISPMISRPGCAYRGSHNTVTDGTVRAAQKQRLGESLCPSRNAGAKGYLLGQSLCPSRNAGAKGYLLGTVSSVTALCEPHVVYKNSLYSRPGEGIYCQVQTGP